MLEPISSPFAPGCCRVFFGRGCLNHVRSRSVFSITAQSIQRCRADRLSQTKRSVFGCMVADRKKTGPDSAVLA